MLLNLTNFSSEPIHQQIVDQVLDRIIDNEMRQGDELTSIRKLSRLQHVNKTTVAKAYNELEKMKIIKPASKEGFVINNINLEKLASYNKGIREKNLTALHKEKIKAELAAARQIQKDLLPKQLPNNKNISVAAYSTISNEVGGDFYDFYEIQKDIYGILIGDASGKGLPAALLISQIQAIIKSDLTHKRTIKQTFNLLNTYLKVNLSAKNFATLFWGIMDYKTGELKYANAGHNFPIIIKNHCRAELLKTTGPALGIMHDAVYCENQTKIEENDIVALYTDGLPETMNIKNEMYGENRIIETLQKSRISDPQSLIILIKDNLDKFRGIKAESDDTTIMIIKKKNNEQIFERE